MKKVMEVGRAANAVKEARLEIKKTQLQLSQHIYESREAVSQQENGRYRVQSNITKYFVEEHNNPWVAMEAAAEYTNWGPSKLDGEATDLHRSVVSAKSVEEIEEALKAIQKASKQLTINPNQNKADLQVIEQSIQQSIDVITALNHYVAILCKEYGISWMKMWTQHKIKLISKRFLKN